MAKKAKAKAAAAGGKAATKSAAEPVGLRFAGQRFFIAGKLQRWEADKHLPALAKAFGGQVASKLAANVDYAVLGRGTSKLKTEIEKLQKQGSAIQLLDESDAFDLFVPSREQLLQLLAGDAAAHARLQVLGEASNHMALPSLKGADLTGHRFSESAWLAGLELDGTDFSKARLDGCNLPDLKNARFDGASLVGLRPDGLSKCQAKNADFSRMEANYSFFESTDFSGSKFIGANLEESVFEGSKFKGADFSQASAAEADFHETDLSGTIWRKAALQRANLKEANLSRAILEGADLTGALLVGADLRGAVLKDANLTGADLTGAKVEGADFRGATLAGTVLDKVALDKAQGIADKQPRKLGQALTELNKAASKGGAISFSIVVQCGKVNRQLSIGRRSGGEHFWATCKPRPKGADEDGLAFHSLAHALRGMAELNPGTPQCGTLQIAASKLSLPLRQLRPLLVSAWCEAYGIDPPSAESLATAQKQSESSREDRFAELISQLRSGPKAISRWNEEVRSYVKRELSGIDLSRSKLPKVDLSMLTLVDCSFSQADLTHAHLPKKLENVNFAGAKMNEVYAWQTRHRQSNFAGASLRKAQLDTALLTGCSFAGADLTEASLMNSDLTGADFTGANLTDTSFHGAKFDEQTRFPAGFTQYHGMKWIGKGPHPAFTAKAAAPKSIRSKRPAAAAGSGETVDFAGLVHSIQTTLDKARVDKALSMLKADAFKLFAEVTPDYVIGVIKSQTDPDLVYSCRLGSSGVYACCTQNLNVCGGLRGSLCKHLLVLLIGLAKGGQLDAATANEWIGASTANQPLLDKDVMSEAFLRYKGAEAGELDWRPTETIPEDYYAM